MDKFSDVGMLQKVTFFFSEIVDMCSSVCRLHSNASRYCWITWTFSK